MSVPDRRLQALFERRQKGFRQSLDGMRQLCESLGHPEQKLRFVHIAGTNGKGSVAAMTAAILSHAGIRTGLYTSPHLIRYHERFRVDGEEIPGSELEGLLDRVLAVSEDATFFEVTTAVALLWFESRHVEVAVWETGLGGRLDATNVVHPMVSVITSIGMDHQKWLGNTLAEIAAEKAGIIKPGGKVLAARQSPEAWKVLQDKTMEAGGTLQIMTEEAEREFQPPLYGNHQGTNTALAVAAARVVMGLLGKKETTGEIQEGLNKTRWPGRCQRVERAGFPPVLLDGAHNPPAMEMLAQEIQKFGQGKPVTVILGVLADKDYPAMLKILRPVTARLLVAGVSSERTTGKADWQNLEGVDAWHETLSMALEEADRLGNPIVITGSLFLVGEALLTFEKADGLKQHPNEMLHVCQKQSG